MAEPFRLALVGAGMITRSSHLPAALASPLAEVVAIIDPVVARAAELARMFGLTIRVAPRVDDVLGDVDGAIIATPNDTHRAIALACLGAGVSTLIEKPLAPSRADGLEIVQAAEATRCTVAVGYATRFRASTILLKELLDQRYFGTIRSFAHQFGTPGGWAPLSSYNLRRETAGGGVLVVTGTHFLDRMLHFFGYPDESSLEDDSQGGPEANCTARFAYARDGAGFHGMARYSKTTRLPGGMVIETDRGYIVLADDDDAQIVFRPHAGDVEQVIRHRPNVNQASRPSVFQRQLEDFIDACRSSRPPCVDGREALESLRLIDTLYANRRGVAIDYYAKAQERVAA